MGSTGNTNRFGLERPHRRRAEFRAAVTRINTALSIVAVLVIAALIAMNGGAQ